MMTLIEYRRKRDFSKTPEPSGARKAAKGRLFVIQKHAASHLHYDFRLQVGDVLKSWAVPKGPSLDPRDKRLAMEVEDHPVDYGSFEGIIPQGEYGGGTVMLWDRGDWEPVEEVTRPLKNGAGASRQPTAADKEYRSLGASPLFQQAAAAGYRAGNLKFNLNGEKLRGIWTLVRRSATAGTSKPQWFLIKHRDEFARDHDEYDVTAEQPLSVTTGRDLDEIAEERDRVWGREGEIKKVRPRSKSLATSTSRRAKKPGLATASKNGHDKIPKFIEPELATLVTQPPAGDSWFHEIKFDGYRIVALVEQDKVRLMTRNELDWTAKMPQLAEAIQRLKLREAIFDGEVVVLDEQGVSQFQLLQNAFRESPGKIIYAVFDLLFFNGHDLRAQPLEARKELLESLKLPVDRGFVRYVEHVVGNGDKFLAAATKQGLEGIVCKRRDRPYLSGRTQDWLKCKTHQRAEFVIGGFTDPDGARVGFGALLAGYHDASGGLHYAGRVGTGFTVKTIDELMAKLKPLAEKKSPFVDFPLRGQSPKGVHWVEPRLIAQVEFSNWTGDKRLRHPSFQGLREDKSADEVTLEKPSAVPKTARAKSKSKRGRAGHAPTSDNSLAASNGRVSRSSASGKIMIEGVELTHPDRVFYPTEEITKRELAEYYVACAERMLPHIVDRPLSIVRCPDGISGEHFFQKHLGPYAPKALRPVMIQEKKGKGEYGVVDDAAGLVALAQIGALEIHVWGSRADRLEQPDQLVFDLDPAPDVEWPRVIVAAEELHEFLQELGLESFAKTSGGKGLHLVLPIARRLEWPEVYEFCRRVALAVERAAPDRYVATMSKKARTGKIFIDYQRNQRGATAVAIYSTRAKPGAPVSMPVAWRELKRVKSATQFKLRDVMKRLAAERADPWDGFFDVRQSISAKMMKMLGE